MAEQERINIRSRQAEGIAVLKSKNNGKGIGRPKAEYPINFKEIYKEWKETNMTAVNAMKSLGLKKNTFYKLGSVNFFTLLIWFFLYISMVTEFFRHKKQ